MLEDQYVSLLIASNFCLLLLQGNVKFNEHGDRLLEVRGILKQFRRVENGNSLICFACVSMPLSRSVTCDRICSHL